MKPLEIHGVGVCAPGAEDWECARSVLREESPFEARPLAKLDIPLLPVSERRRVNATSRLAIHAAIQAVAHLPVEERAQLPSVFASANGDGAVLANMLDALARDPAAMSPTLFHNSVFNAPSGYWTIAGHVGAPSITVSAGDGTFASGLMEAGIEALTSGTQVLYVAYDITFPDSLHEFGIVGDAFACALLLGPPALAPSRFGRITGWSCPVQQVRSPAFSAPVTVHFVGNPSSAALPLLAAIARRTASSFALPYHDGDSIELDYTP
ncbi:MAG: beta-ketoacyl synthase chain length factor [Casimicrobiaceae bacterium]